MLIDTKSRLSTAKAGFAGKSLSLLFIAILLLQITTLAQAPDTLWTKTYGGNSSDAGRSVQQTNDGGYIITGYTSSFGAGNLDVYLIKTDLAGDTLWTKTYGAENGDAGLSVQQTSDGGYIITGFTDGDVYLIKTDSSGDTLWTKTYGAENGDGGLSVQQTSDGGYIITGNANAVAFSVHEVFLIKTDSSGDTLWTKIFTESSNSGGYSVQQTTDGGYIITGGTDFFGAGSNDVDVFLIKTDSSGDTLWTRTFGGSELDLGSSVQQTNDGGYIITGDTYSFGAGLSDVWVIKTDENGNTLWTRTIGEAGNEWGHSIQQTTDGGYIVCGTTEPFGVGSGDIWLIKIAPELSGWTLQTSGITTDLFSVSFTDANTGTAVGADGVILRTTNGGSTWESQASGTTNWLYNVCFTDASFGVVLGTNGLILRTTNGGVTWMSQSSGYWLHGVSFSDANTGTVVGSDGIILRTTDGGTTWTPRLSGTTNNLRGVSFTDVNTGTAAGDDGTILRTTNGGDTWFSQASGVTVPLVGVCFTDANTGIILGGERDGSGEPITVLRTTDGGTIWNVQSVDAGCDPLDVHFINNDQGTIVGGLGFGNDYNGTIIHTTDGGATWVKQLVNYPGGFWSVYFSDANTGTVVGANGIILRTTTGGTTWVGEDQLDDGTVPKYFTLNQNYPNPFNPSTTIRYSIPQSSNVVIKVFDILGREIETLVNEEKSTGIYELTWYAGSLPSGIYFYRIQAGSFVETKKMILLK